MASIQIISDLHLETPKGYDLFEIEAKAPHLALLGDIGNVGKHKADLWSFLTRQLKIFSTVFFVPGNHEAYHSDWPATLAALRAFEKHVEADSSLGLFVLLDRTIYQIPNTDIAILGCSLFSLIPPESATDVGMGLNDFVDINDWDVEAHNNAHRQDLAWLNTEVARLEKKLDVSKIIIFSHWSPSRDPNAADPRHLGSKITPGFSTDLSTEPCWTSLKVKAWAFGHTHYNCDLLVGTGARRYEPLRLLANQRGYYFSQAKGFDGVKTISI